MAEIVPLDGPADWRSNRDIRFQLVEDRKPVPFAHGGRPHRRLQARRRLELRQTETNKKGEFTIRADRTGIWIIGIEYRKLMLDDTRNEYDFAQFATTLTFEVLP